MSENAQISIGLKVEFEEVLNSGSWVELPEVKDVDGPNLEVDVKDVTDQATARANGGYRVKKGGLKDAGEISFDMLFDPDDPVRATIRSLLGETRRFRLTDSDLAETTTVTAVIQGLGKSEKLGDEVNTTLTIAISGAPTFA